MRVVIAPDSFKGSLSAAGVAQALAQGWNRVRPADTIVQMPIADGGEGTLAVLVDSWGGRIVEVDVIGPVGRPVTARFGVAADGRTAVVEMAEASGVLLVPPEQRNPLQTTTLGTGQLIKAALDLGVERIIVAVGGSGTNDGGAGMAQTLGVRLLDGEGTGLPPGGGALQRLARVDVSGLDPRVAGTRFLVAADVNNPLTGPRGASVVFGPQKGARPQDVGLLDEALAHYAALVEAELNSSRGGSPGAGGSESRSRSDSRRADVPRQGNRRMGGSSWSELPGAGAAGGLGFGLAAFCGAEIRSGADVVLDAVDLDEQLRVADLVITGEGRLDGQSAYGKAPVAVARRARRLGKPVVAVAGLLDEGHEVLHPYGIAVSVSIAPGPIDVETSVNNAGQLLAACGERLARLIGIGLELGLADNTKTTTIQAPSRNRRGG